MKKEIPITFKNILALILYILLTSGAHYIITDIPLEEAVEDVVVEKNSKKGLYLYPRFEIKVEGSETPSMVSKEQFESIEIGDKVSGYMRDEDTFLTDKNIQMELMIGIPILVLFYLILFFWTIGLLNSTTFVKRRKKLHKVMLIALKSSVRVMFIIYFISGLIMISLVATNAFHKLNKMNVTETDAIILGGDWETIRSNQGSYTNHELLLLYSDDKDETYITKKAVTGPTYRAYSKGDTITLFYRDNNVYDTFVQAESKKEIFPAFINFFTFIIGAYLVSLYSFYRKWRKDRQNKSDQQEVEVIHN